MEYSLGLVEVSALGNAIIMLDDMLKAADVEFVATERKLGGRLVTIVVRGELTSVKAAVDAGVARATADGCLKASQVIARPHSEILKFLHLDEDEKSETESGKDKAEVKTKTSDNVKKANKAVKTAKTDVTEKAEVKTAPKRRGRPKKTQ